MCAIYVCFVKGGVGGVVGDGDWDEVGDEDEDEDENDDGNEVGNEVVGFIVIEGLFDFVVVPFLSFVITYLQHLQ